METHCSLGKLHVEREHDCGVGMEELRGGRGFLLLRLSLLNGLNLFSFILFMCM